MSKSCCTSCVCVPSAVLYCREVLKQNIFRIQETDGLTMYISNLDYLILQKSYFKISKVSEIELQRYTDMKITELLYSFIPKNSNFFIFESFFTLNVFQV